MNIDMKSGHDQSSCSISRNAKQKAALWLAFLVITTAAGLLLGNVFAGLTFGLLLGLPLFTGG